MSEIDNAARAAVVMMDALGVDIETAVRSIPNVSDEVRAQVRERLERERVIEMRDPGFVEDRTRDHVAWLAAVDRSAWYHWPRLRQYLIDQKGWSVTPTVRSLDEATDRVLDAMESPVLRDRFAVRGLVVGYVQSGKTANYSALIAKAADSGYRLFIVLSGIHNSLRQQTERRLDAELVGYINGVPAGVGQPDGVHVWHTFTNARLNGDFNPGNASAAALAGPNPVLAVVKKNGPVLRRLIHWLDNGVDADIRRRVPVLIIDDEADQASPNTAGNRPPLDTSEDVEPDPDEEPPSVINALIRNLLNRFSRVTYLAYTATPFANVLIDHRAVDRVAGQDLYPRDFIVSLPRPHGYYGAAAIFGRADDEDDAPELDVMRIVADDDVALVEPPDRASGPVFEPAIPQSLRDAFDDFVLAGAARAQRGDGADAATMLIHTTRYKAVQQRLTDQVREMVGTFRDQWRYGARAPIEARLRERWEDFRRVTRGVNAARDVAFDALTEHINTFVQEIDVRQLNSVSLDELDYDRDPSLKVVVVGGDRLSRGLTLEGLLVSYYVRRALQYDTLMQMGRWFGFRDGYSDLTRIYTTLQLAEWFRHLATVEDELREEIDRYEEEDLTPIQLGVKIRQHPSLMVTSPLKMGAADVIDVSYAGTFPRTITFPFDDVAWLRRNLETTRGFLSGLGAPSEDATTSRPLWRRVPARSVIEFLTEYQTDPQATIVRAREMRDFIRRQLEHDELAEWLVAVMGPKGGGGPNTVDLGVVAGIPIQTIERTRLEKAPRSLKNIASPDDVGAGLPEEQIRQARESGRYVERQLLRARDKREGALLIYPISRLSGHTRRPPAGRLPIFSEPDQGIDVIGLAIAFPASDSAATIQYVVGSVGAVPRAA